ncbi:hypothetical protein DYE49_09810 [Treponema rectale]|uniref:Beta-glucanase (GH16 family) n=1 Tax=Treponema rectale TaxID=744512 RepID=A0A840SJ33_9SPIR|nr:Ig-like domain-containing protein [Treponema rectale]MBB5219392.1 beta-glucanase (GH16 family) [Treponema rectale]QOS40728.1 hypothetical protein DYE49_09810 [Treponema rectale]
MVLFSSQKVKKSALVTMILFLMAVLAGFSSCSASSNDDSEPEVSEITLKVQDDATSLVVGDTLKITATVLPRTIKNPQITWKSNPSSVATVSNGVVTGVSVGNVTVTAKCGKKSAQVTLTVKRAENGETDDSVVTGATKGTSVGTSGTSFEAKSNNVNDYTVLVWSDEFEGTSLKNENWAYETGRTGWGNNESQNYTTSSDNSEVKGEVLRITVKGDGTTDPTSARIKSQDLKYFKYGKLEARIKFDEGNLSWPAFWMLGQNMSDGVTWPYCGEIDIMEHINEDRTVMETVHWNTTGSNPATDTYSHGGWGTHSPDYSGTKPPISKDDWHIYGLKWTENKITMYVDDIDYFSVGLDGTGFDCFKNPFFFILNYAAGGQLVGYDWAPASAFAGVNWNMYIDYIRVYQDENHVVDGVAAVPVESVSVTGTASVKVGSTTTLTATVTPSNATDKTVTWSSDDANVATVSSDGVVTGVSEGSAVITATAGGKSYSVTVSVEEAEVAVTSVTVSGTGSIKVGATTTFTATVTPSNATDKTVTWSSGDTSVATVSSSGVVTGVKAGSAVITATAGGKSGTKTVTVTAESSSGITSPLSGYSLIWNDEFDEADSDGTPLSTKWGYDIGIGYSACTDGKNPNNGNWGNGELQWYSDNDADNTYVSDGTLKIVAKKESSNGMNYTSGRIVTRSITGGQWKYGYIEMSAKIPNDAGVWPAFWMLDQDIYDGENWPGSGEIDIMESSVNLWGSDNVYGTLHCTAGSGGSPVFTKNSTVSFSDGKFHKYAVDWDDDHIDWYYDDVKVFTYNPASYDDGPWPFKEEFYIIINLAVGGNLGGEVPSDFTSSTMEVDYVRVWQKDAGYTDRSGAVEVTGAPSSTVTKNIPDGAKVVYDSTAAATNGITGGGSWNGGWAWSDYTAGDKTLKQVTFSSINGDNACGGWNISSYDYGANAKLHLSVYASHDFQIKPVKPDTAYSQTVSSDGTYEWVDVEIDLGSANTLSQIGFISSVVQTIWVDHVYITESDSGSSGSGGSGSGSGGSGDTGSGIDWSSINFAGDGAGGGAYSNKYKFYSENNVGSLVNIQSSFGKEAGLYVAFNDVGAPSACSLSKENYAQQGAGMLFYISKFTAKETSFTITAGGKTYTCAVYYADGAE